MRLPKGRILASLILGGMGALNLVEAQGNGTSLTELIPLIPTCALQCIIQGLAQVPSALSDPTSTCRNVTLQAPMSACVQGKCSYMDQGKLGLVNAKLCTGVPIDESRKWLLTIVSLVFGPLALIAIVVRTYSRWVIIKKMWWDDWTMLTAGLFLAATLACNFRNVFHNGFGRHYWHINPFRVTELLKIFFAAEIFYVVVITLVKVSILQFYLRVFPTRWFRIANIIITVLVIAAGFGVLFPVFFQCSPVRGAWDRSITSRCLNINILAYATGGIGVGFDIIILLLPIPELLKLNMGRRKKLHVLFMFSLGSIACITSMVRLKYLAEFAQSTDPTWDNTIPVIWSLLEICIAIICACLPALRALCSHYLPKLFQSDSSHGSSSPKDLNSGSSGTYTAKISAGSQSTSKIRSIKSPRLEKSEKIDDGTNNPTTSGRGSWFSKHSFITRDREVVQDIERGSLRSPNPSSTKSPTGTVTTKIWVDQTSSKSSPIIANHDHPLKSNLFRKPSKHNHDTSHFNSNPASSSEDNLSPQIARLSNHSDDLSRHPSTSHSEHTITHKITRTGSEDSIFVLEGPRESDVSDDDSSLLRERGRYRKEKEEIELEELKKRSRSASVSEKRVNRFVDESTIKEEGRGSSQEVSRSRRGGSLDIRDGRGGRLKVPISMFNYNPPPPDPLN